MKRKKVILSAGGTGGHLFPAQVVAEALAPTCEVLFVGGRLSQNPFFARTHFPFKEVSTAPFSVKNALTLMRGVRESSKILEEFAPDLVVGFGSFYTFPLLTSALLKGIPFYLHEQNALPGRVTRLFSPFAQMTAITFPESAEHLRGKKVLEVKFPLRKKVPNFGYYDLDLVAPTVLVFGGSQGAKALNLAVFELATLLPKNFQIVHFTGDKAHCEQGLALYQKLGLRCVVKEFETRMEEAYAIASCAITRAGAATIAELTEFEVPALLIPFPFAKDNHQERNGRHFVDAIGGGSLLLQEKMDVSSLKAGVLALLEGSAKHKAQIASYKKNKNLTEFYQFL